MVFYHGQLTWIMAAMSIEIAELNNRMHYQYRELISANTIWAEWTGTVYFRTTNIRRRPGHLVSGSDL